MTKVSVPDLGEIDYRHLDSTPPEGVKTPTHVLTQEVIVDNKPQPLRVLRPYKAACLQVPVSVGQEATITLHALFSCFEKAKEVSEGLAGDVLWGFQQIGISPALTYKGLDELAKLGYIKFQAKDGAYVELSSTAAEGAFVRYQPKLLRMVYDGEA